MGVPLPLSRRMRRSAFKHLGLRQQSAQENACQTKSESYCSGPPGPRLHRCVQANLAEIAALVAVDMSVASRTVEDLRVALLPLWVACGLEESKGIERSEEPTSELQSLMRISYGVFCLKK